MSRRHSVFFFALLAAPITPAAAQSVGVQGPVAGPVFISQTVRPLLGAPGAATAGPALMTGVQWASIAPGGNWGLITQRGRSARVYTLSGAAPSQVATDGLIDGIDDVVWSRDGSYALAYSSQSAQMQRLQFSGSAASADAPLSLSSFGAVTTLAINPSGSQMAFGASGGGLYLVQAGQSPIRLSAMAQPAAAAFDGTGAILYAIDLATLRILEFNSGSGPIDFASLPESGAGAEAPNPIGLAVSGDSRYLLFADAASSSICVYDRTSQDLVNTIPLDFTPSRLEALSATPAFLLNGDRSNEWLMILDAATSPRVYFVPATVPSRITKEAQ
jgi:hypothetical protein